MSAATAKPRCTAPSRSSRSSATWRSRKSEGARQRPPARRRARSLRSKTIGGPFIWRYMGLGHRRPSKPADGAATGRRATRLGAMEDDPDTAGTTRPRWLADAPAERRRRRRRPRRPRAAAAVPRLRSPCRRLGGLCPVCWGGFRLIERPYCASGSASPSPMISARARCRPRRSPTRRRSSAAGPSPISTRWRGRLVHGLKYRDHVELARWMGGWMARAGAERARRRRRRRPGAAPPLPVVDRGASTSRPRWRRRSARQAASASRRPSCRRIRATAQQVGLSATERDKNVRGAFRVDAGGAAGDRRAARAPRRRRLHHRAPRSRPRPARCCAAARRPSTCWSSPGLSAAATERYSVR